MSEPKPSDHGAPEARRPGRECGPDARTGTHSALLARLLGPAGPEVACETCFEELDRYVELELAGADAEASLPGMAAHLEGCPACREDHDSLLALVRDGPGRSPGSGSDPSRPSG